MGGANPTLDVGDVADTPIMLLRSTVQHVVLEDLVGSGGIAGRIRK